MARRRLLAAALAVVAGSIVAIVPATPASAHAELIGTTPRKGTTVSKGSLRSVRLTFSQQIRGGSVRVVDSRNRTVSTSSGRDPRNVRRLRAVLRRALRSGRHRVRWTLLAADGHTQRGAYSFRVR